ncbi:Na+/H+ antiporter NhaC family protein [Cytobacillus oceanisediminis]|uniref:Na+/H+ antiporter NhaC family protein n=1 Tax=Cytobacillus TaxID=2675230 RepID=UPI00203BC6E7|nr:MULTISPECIES: Na+/H+ antiporter NhaC family protein [Cytobacillus]MBY0159118.1 Na+/H+ antiporter NhaC family protein [Cytobacillus firmus]MCM3393576.1 Na+/H+ antiporter NhaC family protein [Cytobacillus oceanisediminis]MCM3529305.1 Na+/H+ antiporter NhaC family protein [Cytobacillus oceanisediminis]UQX53977.1 Na+/H+ antiporter NhaC family protein [Cytobacillus pseudoceanisediminis]
MANTIFSLLPPLVAIAMVILTRRVLLSLGVGIVTAALLLAEFSITETFSIIWDAVKGIFVSDGELNTWNVYIILFLLVLGVITAFISISGGSRAFGEWAMKRVKTRAGAQIVGAVLGIIIFIDDYFNALAVGQISRPITDRQRVSRAKLAYLIDSTSAPVCVVSPVSSWGAYIIALIGTILAAHNVSEYSAFSAFIQMIPMNLYVWATLAIVFIVAIRGIEIGPMRVHEKRAVEEGLVMDPEKPAPGELKDDLPTSSKGSVGDLVWPIIALVIGTVGAMLWTGSQAVEGNATILQIFENTDVSKSLILGGLVGLVVSMGLFFRQAFVLKGVNANVFGKGVWEGVKSMLPAVYILLFAWAIVDLIGRLETGKYLAGIVESSNMSTSWLPLLLFLIAGIMAFSTGTSWGSFGILLPIAGDIAAATDIALLLPAMSAVLAGAVFGDHCSPISDTTILSSTGAGCNHIDHVMTQLPYALISAGIAAVGYLIVGFTGSTAIALLTVAVLVAAFAFVGRGKKEAWQENKAS